MKTNIQIKIYFKYFVQFDLLNSNESFLYTLIKVRIHHLIKMIQRTNNNPNKSLK